MWKSIALITGVVATLIVLGLLGLWIVPWLLVPTGGLLESDRLKAINDVRTACVAFLVAAGAGVTVLYTAQTFALNRQGQVTDRYTKAVGQLGEASVAVRVGGLYALERIGRDSSRDRETIVSVVAAYVRESSRRQREVQDRPPEDVVAAIAVLNRLMPHTTSIADLREADLRGIDLSRLPPERVQLEGIQT